MGRRDDLYEDELEMITFEEDREPSQHAKNKEYKKRRRDAKERKRTLGKDLLQMSIYLLIVLFLTLFVIKYIGQRTKVEGSSMLPTLQNGDNLIVDKITYRFSDPKRFDIIVFPVEQAFHDQEKSYYIKRIIGLPGETIQIVDGNILINGEVLEENYGLEKMLDPGRARDMITLGEDEYFVLGDNRNNSSDSRQPYVGNVKRSKIIGRARFRIWPFSAFGKVK